MIKTNMNVQIVKLRHPEGAYDQRMVNKRPPKIGDMGVIVDVIRVHNQPICYLVEASDTKGEIQWLSEFGPEEIALPPINEANQEHLTYIRVKWLHNEKYEPTNFYFEIREDDWAIRGIEVFLDGSLQNIEHGLVETPIPSLEELNAMLDFEGIEISKDEFEFMWAQLMKNKAEL